jgi:signal transduction histidine kinase/DNA-binding NarL/FixJ family response regulator
MDVRTQKKILYIEDTFEARALVARLLGEEYVILEAANGLDGIQLAQETSPDLILMDINLPDLSGREAATRIHSLMPDTPIVALTADATKGAREKVLAAGLNGYLTKPIEVDKFLGQVKEFLDGKRETLDNLQDHMEAYQAELAGRLESAFRETSSIENKNEYLNEQNRRIIEMLQRQKNLLEAAARVSQNITSILDLDELLSSTVDIIVEEYDFEYAGIYLLSKSGDSAILKAGHGEQGKKLLSENHQLPTIDDSLIGKVLRERQATIAETEMALPLLFEHKILGALTVEGKTANIFSDDDIAALEALANQVAVAINNAYLLIDLETANQELVRTKTFEAIATATGEAIHWVGNKAAPIPGSAKRVRDDLSDLLALVKAVIEAPTPDNRYWEPLQNAIETAAASGIDFNEITKRLDAEPEGRLAFIGDPESILEDLDIVEKSARTILNIKEDLIGPARQQEFTKIDLPSLLTATVKGMGLPSGVVETNWQPRLPNARADERQIDRVFVNLIKNAWEALTETKDPHITISAERDRDPKFVRVTIKDNGPGIPPEILEKIWVSFFTTKKSAGGTGLGLAACLEIVQQSGGRIWAESEQGKGAAFIVTLPIAK